MSSGGLILNRRLDLADAIGLILGLTVVLWWPELPDPLNLPKFLVLTAGSFALAPFVIRRWVVRAPGVALVPVVAAAVLGVLAAVSALFGPSPLPVTMFGWLGRNDGLLSWLSVIVLFAGAASLNSYQVQRLVTWMLSAATLVAAVSALQVAGVQFPGLVSTAGGPMVGTLGNINFSAGYFGIVIALAAGRALTVGAPRAYRIWAGVLAVALVVLAALNGSFQGPLTVGISLAAMAITYGFAYQGRRSLPARIAAGVAVLAGVATAVLGLLGRGPVAIVLQDKAFQDRLTWWDASTKIMADYPILGVGPGSFARFISEYRGEEYIRLFGPNLQTSAVHNVFLQVGATLGLPALIAWAVVFAGAIALLVRRLVRAPMASPILAAGVVGGLIGYLAQGLISIDMLPLLSVGWVLAGLLVALSQEPVLPEAGSDGSGAAGSGKKKAKAGGAVVVDLAVVPSRLPGRAPTWLLATSAVAAVAAFFGASLQLAATFQAGLGGQSLDSVAAVLRNPLTPCLLRTQVVGPFANQAPGEIAVPVLLDTASLDPRCGGIPQLRSQVLLQTGQLEAADASTRDALLVDPLNQASWVNRATYLIEVGDLEGAEEALDRADDVTALNEGAQGGYAAIEDLRARLAAG